jgi:amidase
MVRPASYCGIYGMKPTWGAISTEGQKVVSISLDTLGFFARSVEDLELLAGVYNLADDEYEQGEESLKIEDCKVGILKTGVWPKAGPGTRAAIQSAVAILNKHGATVTEVELPDDFNAIPDYHSLIVAGEARASFLGEYKMHRQHLDGKLTGHVENASKTSWKDHLHAKDAVSALRPTFDSIAEGYSVILTPSVIDEAPLDLEYTGSPAFNCTWTVSTSLEKYLISLRKS